MTCISVFIVFVVFVASTRVSSVSVSKKISVTNAHAWGDWGQSEYCAEGSYAIGYDMKIQSPQGAGDDTALNGIKLLCQSPLRSDSSRPGVATSSMGPWGDWVGETRCENRGGARHFLTSFSLQTEAKQGTFGGVLNDDSSANYIKFKCRDVDGQQPSYEMSKTPGYGEWGDYGDWSSECPKGTAICGLQTRVEKPDKAIIGDNTALNDVVFHCCN